MPSVCPHCRATVEPSRDQAGRLVCPRCHNTGRPVEAAAPSAPPPSWQASAPPAQPSWQAPPPGGWQAPPQQPWPGQAPRATPKAVAALILGILAVIPYLGLLTFIPAIIVGHMALREIKRSGGALGGKGMAVAGLVMGYVGILWVVMIVMAAMVFVLVSDLSDPGVSGEVLVHADAGADRVTLTLARQGPGGPYADFEVLLDGESCAMGGSPANTFGDRDQDGKWGVGEAIVLRNDCDGAALAAGTHGLTVVIDGSRVLDTRITVG